MIVHQGVYLPDGERHLVDWMTTSGEIVDGRGSYQVKKLRAALAYCKRFRTAIDVGAHVGLWSMQLEKCFANVHAFEPVAEHRKCFVRNLEWGNKEGVVPGYGYVLHDCALGAERGEVVMITTPTSSGDTRIGECWTPRDLPEVSMKLLDDFNIEDVDFIKLDCEGYELLALRGGEQTIRRWKPVIIVEQKPGRAQRYGLPETGAVDFLEGLGYGLARVMSGDYILIPR